MSIAERRKTKREELLDLLDDRQLHHMRELNRITFRYGARFWDLKKLGYVIETVRISDDEFAYRLVAKPGEEGERQIPMWG